MFRSCRIAARSSSAAAAEASKAQRRISSAGSAEDAVGDLLAALKKCSRNKDLGAGKDLHDQVCRSGLLSNKFVANGLITMYAKCGSMAEARRVFDCMNCQDMVSWNTLLNGYVENGEGIIALELFESLETNFPANARTYVAAVSACTALAEENQGEATSKWLQKAKSIHSRAVQHLRCNNFVKNTLIKMYATCGKMHHARCLFDNMSEVDVVSWNCLVRGYVKNGESKLALELLARMDLNGTAPNSATFVAALMACADLVAMQHGKLIHLEACVHGLEQDVANSLLDFYCKCGDMLSARRLFSGIERKILLSWNTLMTGYKLQGDFNQVFKLFEDMEQQGTAPDAVAFLCLLTACSQAGMVDRGREVFETMQSKYRIAPTVKHYGCMIDILGHGNNVQEVLEMVESMPFKLDTRLTNCLMNVYVKLGNIAEARSLFEKMVSPDVVSWNTLLQGYVDQGESQLALKLFNSMEDARNDCSPDARSYVAALMATFATESDTGRLEKLKALHSRAVMSRCCNSFVENTLINLYAQYSSMVHSQTVFDRMEFHTIVSWNCLIQGYLDQGQNQVALDLIATMDTQPDSVTFAAALFACGNLIALEAGKAFHLEISRRGLAQDIMVANCLVDFYGRCGSMEAAKQVFDSIAHKSVITWNSFMCGYSLQGDTEHVFLLFNRMKEQGVLPNAVTFLCLLSACSHAGLVFKGKEYFDMMDSRYGVHPTVKHYACMVDLLGRANHLEEALKLIKDMPLEADGVIWSTLLAACKKWNNVGIGKVAYEALLAIDDKDPATYVLMANTYRAA